AELANEQQRARLGLDEVAAALPPRSALVAYVVYRHQALPSAEVDSGATAKGAGKTKAATAKNTAGDSADVAAGARATTIPGTPATASQERPLAPPVKPVL